MAKLPESIDKYPIEQLLAEGGMSAVYLGTHPTLEHKVILKKLTLRGDKSIGERFRREARILLNFRHDNIVDVFDHFVSGRSNYIAMEYVQGLSAKELLDRVRYMDNAVAAYITLQTAKALAYAHGKSVIHRDIKPANVLISIDGEVKLADFGIASSKTSEDHTLTSDGTTLGTPAYMAPEQFQNSRTVDLRADIYSLGVMLYELLCGVKPFPGGFSPEVIQAIQKGKYRKPVKHNPAIDRRLQKLIRHLMRTNRKHRPDDLSPVISFLKKYLAEYGMEKVQNRLASLVKEEKPQELKRKPRGRKRNIVTASIALTVLAGLVAVFLSVTGIHQVLFKPGEYALISLSAETSQRPVSALYSGDGPILTAMERTPLFFRLGDSFVSLPLALPAGSYRLKSITGSQLSWNSFTLRPRSEQASILELPIDPPISGAQLLVSVLVIDATTGIRLGSSARVEIQNAGLWQEYRQDMQLFSGQLHRFRISAEGYQAQEFDFLVDDYQRDVTINAELLPLGYSLNGHN